ncbi:MAG: addiction module protein [Sandaracinaceae bacterium]|nr:addiction module protein [Sandaracinaceae bacterium]
MGDRARKLLDEVLDLPAEDRAVLSAELAESLEHPPEPAKAVEAAWRVEIARRIHEMETGEVELLDGEAVLEALRARYPRR